MKSMQLHKGAIFATGMEGKWLFTGGWDKTVNVQVHVQMILFLWNIKADLIIILVKNLNNFIMTIDKQELSGDDIHVDPRPIGCIPCGSVITVLLFWQGKLFVGSADRLVKV